MQPRVFDFNIIIVAMAFGASISLLEAQPSGWPFDGLLFRPILAGSLILCPIILLKQFAIDRRTTPLRAGEWLWITSFLWAAAANFAQLFLVLVGLILFPVLLILAGIYWLFFWIRLEHAETVWTDTVGLFVAAAMSVAFILFAAYTLQFP
jgi:hypothetical protein